MLFSATLDGAIGRLAGKLLRDPVRIEVAAGKAARQRSSSACISPTTMRTSTGSSIICLTDIAMTQSIVFIATKRDAEALAMPAARRRPRRGARCTATCSQREAHATRCRTCARGGVRTLVATDVAARGHRRRPASAHVINFDLPRQADDYVFTASAAPAVRGATGIAISLAPRSPDARNAPRQIERHTGARDRRRT